METLCLYLLIHQHTIFTSLTSGPRNTRPRPYLCAAVVHALEAVDAGQRGIVHLPTGTGKTVQVGKVTEHYYHRGKRTLFLHHRRELRTQTRMAQGFFISSWPSTVCAPPSWAL